ncbi:MAG: MATE family efflux transporter [Bacteroidales bacterium]|nr:MATE family efflux transporter [Bacteroidales bacterium]
MKNIDELVEKNINSLFWKYTIPSIAMMLILSAYFITDSIFIGRGVGSEALASVNLTIPFMMIANSIGMSLAIGASIIISIYLSQKQYEKANKIFSNIFLINTVLAFIFMIVGFLFSDQIVLLLGATPDTVQLAVDYLSIILYFIFFFTMHMTLTSVIRNDGNPNLAMYATIMSSLLNIPLDALFIFKFGWGVKGAALATGLAQVTGVAVLLFHFILKQGRLKFTLPKFNFKEDNKIFINAIPIFIGNIFLPVSMFLMNNVAARTYSTLGISAFAIVNNISMFIFSIIIGISQGIQPIISFNFGQNKVNRMIKTLWLGIGNSLLVIVFLIVSILVFSEQIIGIYSSGKMDASLMNLTKEAIRIYVWGYVFLGSNFLFASYFQSIEFAKSATVINILRTTIILIPVAFLISLLLPDTFIWAIIMASEMITLIVILTSYHKDIFRKYVEVAI